MNVGMNFTHLKSLILLVEVETSKMHVNKTQLLLLLQNSRYVHEITLTVS